MSDYDDTEDLTDDECRQLLRVIAHERDCLRAALVRAHDGDAIAAARAERAITAPPWRYKEWGGLVVGGGEGSAEVLICTMATNTRHDEGRHNRELIIDAPTLRARLDKAEAEAARLRTAIEQAPHTPMCVVLGGDEDDPCCCWKRAALQEGGR